MKKNLLLAGATACIALMFFLQFKQPPIDGAAIHIGFVGDAMIGRMVNELLRAKPDYNIWGTMLPIMQQQNMVVCNLETALTTYDQPVPKVFNFKSDPTHVQLLKQAHIGIVNLANNHVLDYGLPGFEQTVKTLVDADIAYVGAGKDETHARMPHLFTINGTRFALFGATDNEPTWQATDHAPGTNYVQIGDEHLLKDIKAVRNYADIIIVTLHWGPNMREYPSRDFINYAHAIIDAGADIIAGHSAHVLQGIERYKGKLILYDMGDFIDDYAIDAQLRNDLTALFSVAIENKKITKLSIIPARISEMTVNQAVGENAKQIIDMIIRRSQPFGAKFEQNDMRLEIGL